MQLSIVHNTRYNYTKPVSLLPHYIRLKPQNRHYFTLQNFELTINPEPMSISERIDAENNPFFQIWMEPVPIKEFVIKAKIDVVVKPFDPFHFIIDPPINFLQNQFHYPEKQKRLLGPYLEEQPGSKELFDSFLNERIKGCDKSCILFLTDLLHYIFNKFEHETKEEDMILDAVTIYHNKRGSCKELSWMLMEMLRTVGLASRFVSGYAYNPVLGDGHELHAWVEVLLPGAGWIGLDPSSGLFADEHYIPIAASFNPELTMPVSGKFSGIGDSKLRTSVSISETV